MLPNSTMALLVCIMTLFFLTIHHTKQTVAESSLKGFSLELIHPDSIHSPLYPGKQTPFQKLKRQMQQSKPPVLLPNSTHFDPQNVDIRPIISHQNIFSYMVKVGIGSPPVNLHLVFDTDSSLIWTQCEPCKKCFPQLGPRFNSKNSTTFNLIPCNHTLCKRPYKCRNEQCVYNEMYMDESGTEGLLATEKLTFNSKSNGTEPISLVFGCSHTSTNRMLSTKVSGILGMSSGKESLIKQLSKHIHGKLRFSYCLSGSKNHSTYLRFGSDIVTRKKLQHIPIESFAEQLYNLALIDVGVNNQRLRLPPGSFKRHMQSGGCTIDTGTPISRMATQPYNRFKQEIVKYFKAYHLDPIGGKDSTGLDLCYRKPRTFVEFPSMDYHFHNAVLHVEGGKLFEVIGNKFCMLMIAANQTVIGAGHQRDVQFVFDLTRKVVSFAPENCATL